MIAGDHAVPSIVLLHLSLTQLIATLRPIVTVPAIDLS